MYAVIRTGGKQYRVAEGERLDVELLAGAPGAEVSFAPVLVVDGGQVSAGATDLAGAQVVATVVGEAAGPKIRGFTYKNKTNSRRHWGHRQHYTTIQVTAIRGRVASAATAGITAASTAATSTTAEEA